MQSRALRVSANDSAMSTHEACTVSNTVFSAQPVYACVCECVCCVCECVCGVCVLRVCAVCVHVQCARARARVRQ